MTTTLSMDHVSTRHFGTRPKTRTFRRKRLEAEFLEYCQLSTEAPKEPSSEDIGNARRRAENFIHSADFTKPSAESTFLGDSFLDQCEPEVEPKRSSRKLNLPSHLAGLTETRLLTPEQECRLFQRMNYLRYRALRILEQASDDVDQWDLERILGLLRAADWHRDVIVKANVRLVISIVKKFVNPQCGFDDLLSDGIMALIRSVDKFDYQLGYRFSTYATQVVRRNSYRFVMERQEERLKITNSIGEPGLDVPAEASTSTMSETRWNSLQSHLRLMLDSLDKRERLIVRARFSLGSHRRVQTLQRLADRLGISKERVRQLEKRAVEKLQRLAIENPPEIVEAEAC